MQLIKGTYSKEDALQIVQQIIQVKINFHEEKISLSENEEDIKMREKRIKDLQSDLAVFRRAIYAQSGAINMDALLSLNKAESVSRSFSLINGTFDLDDAREILYNAFKAKINFHKLKAWSKSERGEVGVDLHTARALELEIEADRIKELLLAKMNDGTKITITSTVSLEFESENEDNVRTKNFIHSH